MSMTRLERERGILYLVRTSSNLSRPPSNEYAEILLHCEARVAELEAEARVEKKREQPHVTNREALARLDERLDSADAKIQRLVDSLADLQNDLQCANMRAERVERKVEEDLKRMNHQSAEIQKVRNWCSMHNHYWGRGHSSKTILGETTGVPSDTSNL